MHQIVTGLALGVIALVAFQTGFYSTHTTQAAEPDNRGTEFVLGFNQNMITGVGSNTLFVGADEATTVTVSVPGIGFGPTDFAVVPGATTSIGIPLSARMVGSGSIQNKGILVTAPKDIFIYGLNYEGAATDGFLGLPVDIQSTDYLIPSYFNVQGTSASELGVVGISDNTTVTITPSFASQPGSNTPATVPAVTPFSITLNRLQTFQLKDAGVDSTGDLTGSVITSNKPISVFGAHECAYVPVNVPSCDHLVEQIPPTSTWGTDFLTVPLATRTGGDVFRILASQNGTSVTLNSVPLGGTINRGQFIETDIPSTTFARITSDKPVLVTQYSKGSNADLNYISDPFMMIIPPVQQFESAYTFSTPAGPPVVYATFTNHVNIAAPSAQLAGMRLDGLPVSSAWTPIGTSGYSGTQVQVAIGTHTVSHTSPTVAFGIYVYGFSNSDAYGYPGGMRLAPIANSPGSITICKQTDPDPAVGNPGFVFADETNQLGFILHDNDCHMIPTPNPSTYSVSEPPSQMPPGWTLTNIDCRFLPIFQPFFYLSGTTAVSINLAQGEDVTCTFTNTRTDTSVGGVAALTVSSSGSSVPWMPRAAVGAGVVAMTGAGLWYGRRRWLR